MMMRDEVSRNIVIYSYCYNFYIENDFFCNRIDGQPNIKIFIRFPSKRGLYKLIWTAAIASSRAITAIETAALYSPVSQATMKHIHK